ncbi:Flp family type IVb pilin [Rhodobacterales bacterium]|nr:Flp family type IVb pilin [Rhodobacterales bacterium]
MAHAGVGDLIKFLQSNRFSPLLRAFVRDEKGATTIEYGLIVALIAVTLIVTIAAIGEQLRDDVFGKVVSMMQSVISG